MVGEFFLDPVAGGLLNDALSAARSRPGKDDTRTSEQRNADALVDLATLTLNTGEMKTGALVRPHAIVIIHADNGTGAKAPAGTDTNAGSDPKASTDPPSRRVLSRAEREASKASCQSRHLVMGNTNPPGDGSTDQASAPSLGDVGDLARFGPVGRSAYGLGPTGEPVNLVDGTQLPPTVAARLLCDAEWTRVVLSTDSQVLDLGQSVRLFTRELRKAIIARDRTCRWKGCDRKAMWSDIHHLVYFENGGHTSASNGVLLCTFHHHEVHRRALGITITDRGVVIMTSVGELLSYTDHPETLRTKARRSTDITAA